MAAMEADPMAEEEASEEGDDDEAAAAGAPAKKVKVTDVPVELTAGDLILLFGLWNLDVKSEDCSYLL